MTVRYFIELTLFFAAAIVFTYFISIFNTEKHHLVKDIKLLHLMQKEFAEYKGFDKKLIEKMKEEIHHEKEIASEEVELAFEGLNETMFISFVALTFPL